MASAPWSPRELALLERHADTCDWRSVAAELTDRTTAAIKVRMAKLRSGRTAGGRGEASGDYSDARGLRDDDWTVKAALASQKLLEATLRVGVWS